MVHHGSKADAVDGTYRDTLSYRRSESFYYDTRDEACYPMPVVREKGEAAFRRYTYFLNAALLVIFRVLAPINHGSAADPCKGDCILQSDTADQNCAIEQMPLVRCEKFSEFKKRDADLNTTCKAVYSTLDESGRND